MDRNKKETFTLSRHQIFCVILCCHMINFMLFSAHILFYASQPQETLLLMKNGEKLKARSNPI